MCRLTLETKIAISLTKGLKVYRIWLNRSCLWLTTTSSSRSMNWQRLLVSAISRYHHLANLIKSYLS